jgi:hypothetical protein
LAAVQRIPYVDFVPLPVISTAVSQSSYFTMTLVTCISS